jgi:hypothetical protein
MTTELESTASIGVATAVDSTVAPGDDEGIIAFPTVCPDS